MARNPEKHNKNWGGNRAGSGRPKGSVSVASRRATMKALEMAEAARYHPFQYLLDMIADKTATKRERLQAAAAALPYCAAKLSQQAINVNHKAELSITELEQQLESIDQLLVETGHKAIVEKRKKAGVPDLYDSVLVRHVSGETSTLQFKAYAAGRQKGIALVMVLWVLLLVTLSVGA